MSPLILFVQSTHSELEFRTVVHGLSHIIIIIIIIIVIIIIILFIFIYPLLFCFVCLFFFPDTIEGLGIVYQAIFLLNLSFFPRNLANICNLISDATETGLLSWEFSINDWSLLRAKPCTFVKLYILHMQNYMFCTRYMRLHMQKHILVQNI